jgi:hypothetical protein
MYQYTKTKNNKKLPKNKVKMLNQVSNFSLSIKLKKITGSVNIESTLKVVHWLYFWDLNCGDWIMRSLWELDISTTVTSVLWAEFGTALAAEKGRNKMQSSCFS